MKFRAIIRLLVIYRGLLNPKFFRFFLELIFTQEDLERKLYIIRKRTEIAIRNSDIKTKEFLLYPKSFNKSAGI